MKTRHCTYLDLDILRAVKSALLVIEPCGFALVRDHLISWHLCLLVGICATFETHFSVQTYGQQIVARVEHSVYEKLRVFLL